ncbi:MAG: hypothetical protein NVS9B15_09910 [Acidobacteriaceae bacterium]
MRHKDVFGLNACNDRRIKLEPEAQGDAGLREEYHWTAMWLGCPVTAADIDDAVSKIFRMVLGTVSTPRAHGPMTGERISATIRLSGSREARCTVEMPAETGDWLTDGLMGSEADWDDEMIHDAVGELCNMVTGALKHRLGAWLGNCRTSLPEVCRSRSGELDAPAGTAMHRTYSVGASSVAVTLAFYPSSYRTTD